MTIKTVIDTLDEFRNEYATSQDPEVRRLCGFIVNTITILNKYLRFFTVSKSRIEQSQAYYESVLETIDQLLETNSEVVLDPSDQSLTLDDILGSDDTSTP